MMDIKKLIMVLVLSSNHCKTTLKAAFKSHSCIVVCMHCSGTAPLNVTQYFSVSMKYKTHFAKW